MGKNWWCALLLVTLGSCCGRCDGLLLEELTTTGGKVVELEESNFDAAIASCRYVLVDFYAPWCGHCMALSPQLDEVASRLANSSPRLMLAKINADKFTGVSSKYKISAYPTLKLFIDGFPTDYTGPHKADLMASQLKRMLAPAISSYAHARSGLTEFLDNAGDDLPIFIAFGLQQSAMAELAQEHKARAWFAVVEEETPEDLMAEYGLSKVPALLVQHQQQIFYGPFEGNDLATFVKHNLLPSVTPLAYENLDLVKEDGRPIFLTIVKNLSDSYMEILKQQLKALARVHDRFVFAFLDASSWPPFADIFHIRESSKLPQILIWTGGSEFYTSQDPGELNKEDMSGHVLELVEAFKDNRAKKTLTKQPSSIEQLMGFIGQNFVYVLLFIVSVVVFLQSMDWKTPPNNLPAEQ